MFLPYFFPQAAIASITMLTIGTINNIAHQLGLPNFSKTFHIHITKNTVNARENRLPRKGIKIPINRSIGHHGILAMSLAINAGPTAGIHAIPGAYLLFPFFAIDMKANDMKI